MTPADGDKSSFDIPFSPSGTSEPSAILRAGRAGATLYLELVEVSSLGEENGDFECVRISLPAHVGPEILDTLYALIDDNAPSAIAAIDDGHTWVAERIGGGDRVSLRIHPGDIFTWQSSQWNFEFDLPMVTVPALAHALAELTRLG
jgi:hypothetical protein